MINLTIKQASLYVANPREFDVNAWGACHDEAVNNLTDQVREQNRAGESAGDEKNRHAIR